MSENQKHAKDMMIMYGTRFVSFLDENQGRLYYEAVWCEGNNEYLIIKRSNK
jgi:hypothetical protein